MSTTAAVACCLNPPRTCCACSGPSASWVAGDGAGRGSFVGCTPPCHDSLEHSQSLHLHHHMLLPTILKLLHASSSLHCSAQPSELVLLPANFGFPKAGLASGNGPSLSAHTPITYMWQQVLCACRR